MTIAEKQITTTNADKQTKRLNQTAFPKGEQITKV
jgi:hypothetical protein